MSGTGSAALAALAPDLVLEAETLGELGLEACLGRSSVGLDVGFGRGEVLIDLARRHPERAWLGVEVSRKRVGKTARRLLRAELQNARLVHAPAEFLLERVLPEGSISECWINFPDPWPKKRHHKRRLIRSEVVVRLARVLRPGAALHVATDHVGYRDWIAEVLESANDFENLCAPDAWSARRPDRCETAYEAEYRALGREIAFFEYVRAGRAM